MKANLPFYNNNPHMKPHWYKPKPEPLLAPAIDIRRIANKKITLTPSLEPRDVGVLRMLGSRSKSVVISKAV